LRRGRSSGPVAWPAIAALVAAAATAVRAGEPALDYALNCQGCHRADGAGTPESVPALAGSVGKFLRVPGGREFLGQVPGVALSSLDDAALAGVLNWILARFGRDEVPPGFAPYTTEEVGRLRRSPLTDVEGVRRRLLGALERSK
jgi:mono/diheme cytochrome c family protein